MITPLIGSVGAGLVLIAFGLGQLNVWRTTYFVYDLLNLVGGALLVWYAFDWGSWPFVALNGVWTLLALRDAVSDLKRSANERPPRRGFWKRWME